jgi:hypothetical protein
VSSPLKIGPLAYASITSNSGKAANESKAARKLMNRLVKA